MAAEKPSVDLVQSGLIRAASKFRKRSKAQDVAAFDALVEGRALKPPPFPDTGRAEKPGAIEARKLARKEPPMYVGFDEPDEPDDFEAELVEREEI